MIAVVPVTGTSSKIYRFRLISRVQELPEAGGIYCFCYPLRYPGAPIEGVYLGHAQNDLKVEVLQNETRRVAIEIGANKIGFIKVNSRLARRRIYADLVEVFPDDLLPGGTTLGS